MNALKKKLIKRATQAYKHIYPCTNKRSLYECFTSEGERLLFWFNTADNNTHLLIGDMKPVQQFARQAYHSSTYT